MCRIECDHGYRGDGDQVDCFYFGIGAVVILYLFRSRYFCYFVVLNDMFSMMFRFFMLFRMYSCAKCSLVGLVWFVYVGVFWWLVMLVACRILYVFFEEVGVVLGWGRRWVGLGCCR